MTPWQIAGTATGVITTIGAMLGTFFLIDDRYAHREEFQTGLVNAKNEIITEMRREVVLNRSVMIEAMQREADDLDFQMELLRAKGETIPRYMKEKHLLIIRQIEEIRG